MSSGNTEMPDDQEQAFEALFQGVTARPRPPEGLSEVAFRRFSDDLNRSRSGWRRRRLARWSVAATVLLAVLAWPLLLRFYGQASPAASIGKVVRLHGQVSLFSDGQPQELGPTDTAVLLYPQQAVVTGHEAGISIGWAGEKAVRIDQGTRLELVSADEIRLDSGRIYVDVPPGQDSGGSKTALHIVTRLGTIYHTGTQFMVEAGETAVEVRVREGSVTIDSGVETRVADRGEKAVMARVGLIETASAPTWGDEWQWVEQLTPTYPLEGSTLRNFLTWVQRETGKELIFESPHARFTADTTILHGSLDQEPMDSLAMILDTTELGWREQDGIIHIYQ